jgi:hypothetical protein
MSLSYNNSILAQTISVSGVNTNVSGVLQVNGVNVSVSGHTHTASDVGALTQTTADSRYVELTGDTMSGGLTINAATPLSVTGGRTFLAPNNERFGLGVRYNSTGGAVYFGATDATTTPGMQISKAGGVAMMTITNAGAASIPGTLTVGGSEVVNYAGLARAENQPPSVLDIFPRGQGSQPNATPLLNQVYVTMFTPSVTITVSSIAMACGTTVASGLTLARMGLYTFDETTLTLVARTASDTTMFAVANTLYQRNFSTVDGYPASYTLNAGSRYAVAVVATGTTTPSYNGRTVGVGIATQTPRMNAVLSGSDLPVSATVFSTAQGHVWARLA